MRTGFSHLLLECVFAASLVSVIVNVRRAATERMVRGATLVVRRRILPIHRLEGKGYRCGERKNDGCHGAHVSR
jgi:hypothetical protein